MDDLQHESDRIAQLISALRDENEALRRQIRALERAWDQAGVPRASVGLMEAHGTGTVVGDRTELQSMERVFGGRGISPGACVLGSIKPSIGHSKAAAGVSPSRKRELIILPSPT